MASLLLGEGNDGMLSRGEDPQEKIDLCCAPADVVGLSSVTCSHRPAEEIGRKAFDKVEEGAADALEAAAAPAKPEPVPAAVILNKAGQPWQQP